MSTRSYCTFRVENLVIGVDVARVQEVLHGRSVTPVPLSPPCIAGLANLRGQIVTVVDMRARLGLSAAPTSRSVHVVVQSCGEVVSLSVDQEGDVVDVDDAATEDVAEVVDAAITSCVDGVSKRDDGLLLILDPDRVLSGLAT